MKNEEAELSFVTHRKQKAKGKKEAAIRFKG